MDRTICKIMLFLFVGMLILAFDIQSVSSELKTIVVPDDYPTIQEAINAANDGDKIFVKTGVYYENLIVNKTVLLFGENKDGTVIDGNGIGTVVYITSNKVTISGFTIRNSGQKWPDSGILLYFCNQTILRNNNFVNNSRGIFLWGSNNNSIEENILFNNSQAAIELLYSNDNTFNANSIVNNNLWGVCFRGSSNNTIQSNNIANNGVGIHIIYSSANFLRENIMSSNYRNFGVEGTVLSHFVHDIDVSNTVDGKPVYYFISKRELNLNASSFPDVGYLAIVNSTDVIVEGLYLISGNLQGVLIAYTTNTILQGNVITGNFFGLDLVQSSNITISNNRIEDNWAGIQVSASNNTIIRENNIKNWVYGIYLFQSRGNAILGNNVTETNYGIYLSESGDNSICHNNFINNRWHAIAFNYSNTWDSGYPSGGNYWSNHVTIDRHSGPYQNETESDGIVDMAYIIDAYNTDRYPLMAPFKSFNAGTWNEITYNIDVVSNSSVSDFNFDIDNKIVRFNVYGDDGTTGFCRVTIPKGLLWAENGWTITLGDKPITDYLTFEDENFTYLYFTYNHSAQTVIIQGNHVITEFPSVAILPLFTVLSIIVIVFRRENRRKKKAMTPND